jgi:hypothetical protein
MLGFDLDIWDYLTFLVMSIMVAAILTIAFKPAVDHSEAVRVVNLKYRAGTADVLSVLQLQTGQIDSEMDLIQLRNNQLANRMAIQM